METDLIIPNNSTSLPSQLVDGDIGMMVFATTFVMLQTPAMGIAQAGMIRRKNALSMLMQTLVGMCIGSVLWYIVGFALVFGDTAGGFIGNPFGSIGWFLRGVSIIEPNTSIAAAADTIPGLLLCAYQMMFALMVPVIVTGCWAERLSFEAFLIFVILWPFLVYYPIAHWLWNSSGFLSQWGALDFAGGITIHTSSGFAALAVVLVLTARKHYKGIVQQHHNMPLSTLGAVLIWGGWYSFNGGSAYKANFQAASALFNTHVAACCGGLTWMLLAKFETGKWPLSAVINGVFAGLAGVTAGSGLISQAAAILVGVTAATVGFFTVKLRLKLGLDDVCEVIALQGAPGFVGSMLNGLLVSDLHFACDKNLNPSTTCTKEGSCVKGSGCGSNGVFFGGDWSLLGKQFCAALLCAVWSFFFTYLIMLFIRETVGIEVSPDQEEKGLDVTQMGEHGYDHDLTSFGEVYSAVSKELLANDAEKLVLAAREGDIVQLHRLLLFSHVSASSVTFEMRSASHVAAAYGHLNFLKELYRFGCPLDCVDRKGRTPLTEAIANGADDVIAWLIAKGISANTVSIPSQMLLRAGNDNTETEERTEEQFKEQMSNSLIEQFFEAASVGDAPVLRRLIAAAVVDINVQDYDGRSALHILAAEGHTACIELLINSGANVVTFDRWGQIPLEDAESEGFEDCVEILKKATNLSHTELTMLKKKHNFEKHGGDGNEDLNQTIKRNAFEIMLGDHVPSPNKNSNNNNDALSGGAVSVPINDDDDDDYNNNENTMTSPLLANFANKISFRNSFAMTFARMSPGNKNKNKNLNNNASFVKDPQALLEKHMKSSRPKPRKAQLKERMKLLLENKTSAAAASSFNNNNNKDSNNNNYNNLQGSSVSMSTVAENKNNNTNHTNQRRRGNSRRGSYLENLNTTTPRGNPVEQQGNNTIDLDDDEEMPFNNENNNRVSRSPSGLSMNNSIQSRSSITRPSPSVTWSKTDNNNNNNNNNHTPRTKSNNKDNNKLSRPAATLLAEAAADFAGVRELSAACATANLKEVKRLLRKGVDPTAPDLDSGRCALHHAAVAGSVEVMKALLSDATINVNVLDRNQNTPLSEALDNKNPKTAELIRQAGGTVVQRKTGHALCKAAAEGRLDLLLRMHERGVDIRCCDYDGRSALHLAACEGRVEIVKWLLDLEDGFKQHSAPIDRFGNSPLLDSIREKQTECFNLLADRQISVQSEQQAFGATLVSDHDDDDEHNNDNNNNGDHNHYQLNETSVQRSDREAEGDDHAEDHADLVSLMAANIKGSPQK